MCPVQSVIQFLDEKKLYKGLSSLIFLYGGPRLELEQATVAGNSSVMLGWSWTDLSVLGSQLFGQASAEQM